MKNKDILNFFAEVGILKRIKRSGWWMVGVPYEESVAEHSFRCASIGYILAKMEDADTYKVLVMTLFNDLHEARIGDAHKVANKYLNLKEAEKKAFTGQISNLDKDIKGELKKLREETDAQKSREAMIARDADILECLLQAKEYSDLGFHTAEKFFKKGPQHLKTKSALKLWKSAKDWNSNNWWDKLEKFDR